VAELAERDEVLRRDELLREQDHVLRPDGAELSEEVARASQQIGLSVLNEMMRPAKKASVPPLMIAANPF
jgi:hypothetical protein